MDAAVARGVFPGGVLLAAHAGRVLSQIPAGRLTYAPDAPPVTPGTIYDLASLTKVLSTTYLTMLFLDRKLLSLDSPLESFWPEDVPAEKRGLTVAHLLGHASGLPAWRPYHEHLKGLPEEIRREALKNLILKEPLGHKPGTAPLYSDLGFILLGLMLEKLAGKRQDSLFKSLVAEPLGLSSMAYGPESGFDEVSVAPTGENPSRGGVVQGTVNDDNAAAMGGVAGHAGLFGTAEEVWRVFNSLRCSYIGDASPHPVRPETVRTFWRPSGLAPDSTRALGFDMPAATGSSAGRLISRRAVGHLGFTGTSLWYDPDRDLCIILLTNRVHPSAANIEIRAFRPLIHDTVVASFDEGAL